MDLRLLEFEFKIAVTECLHKFYTLCSHFLCLLLKNNAASILLISALEIFMAPNVSSHYNFNCWREQN